MWDKTFLLLLSVEAAVASQCHQGASFSEAVVSLMVDSSRIRRVPGVASLSQCVAACCDLPGYNLAWLFQGRCFILSCRRRDDCRPQRRARSDSQLAFLRRTLNAGHRGILPPSSEAPGDLEDQKSLVLADGLQQDFSKPGRLDLDYPWEEGGGSEVTTKTSFSKRDKIDQSEADDGLEGVLTESRDSFEGTIREGGPGPGSDLGLGPGPAQRPVRDSSAQTDDRDSTRPTTRSTQYAHIRTSPPLTATPHWPVSTSVPPDSPTSPSPSTAPPADRSLPPIAHASGSHTVSLPNSSLVLRGSVTQGDQNQIQYLWVRDNQSPAAGDVLYGSETQASLYLANLVEGTYLFQLRVTDAQGRSCTATATVEVRPEPGGGQEVELEMLVSVSQVSVAQRDMVVRQLAALLHVLDGDIQVRALQGHSHLSTVMRFLVWGPSGPIPGSSLVGLLRNQLLREKSDYLLFRVLRVDTVLCLLRCSGHGQCDPITKQCSCDPFWTGNLIRRFLGDGESNCEWRVLYVILTSVILMVFILSLSWTFICCCRRRTRVRRKTRYTILDDMDDQERVELRPRFSIKHRSTEHNSSLMMSESELDSDQDAVFSRGRPVRSRNRINGNTFS